MGFGEALFGALRNPLIGGTAAGAAIGAGTGYFSSPSKSSDIRTRQALSGAAVGAGIGALSGALSGHSNARLKEIFETGKEMGLVEGKTLGRSIGHEEMTVAAHETPGIVARLVETMEPAKREETLSLISKFTPEKSPSAEAVAKALESMDPELRHRVIKPHMPNTTWWSVFSGRNK